MEYSTTTRYAPRKGTRAAMLGLTVLGVAFCLATTSLAVAGDRGDKAQIRDLLATYQRALNGNDVDGVIALYAADGVFLQEYNPAHVGHANIRRSYEGVFKAIDLNVGFQIKEIEVIGDGWGFVRTTSDGTIKINATGDQVPNAGQELFLLNKAADGKWKIARYAFSATVPPSH